MQINMHRIKINIVSMNAIMLTQFVQIVHVVHVYIGYFKGSLILYGMHVGLHCYNDCIVYLYYLLWVLRIHCYF